MTPQIRLVAIGAAAAAVSKFFFQHDVKTSALIGTGTIAAVAILTAQDKS